MRSFALAVAALGLLAAPAWGITVEPALRAELLGGQYFFSGDKGALSGNANLSLVPAVRVNDRVRLVPIFSSSYQGSKQATDLIGAGTLFQEQMEHRLAVRAILESGERWRLKPSLGFAYDLYRETKDERWGGGLFDNRRLSVGFEAEYLYDEPYSVRAAIDYFHAAFPNYTSLESRAGVDAQGLPLARELASDSVLDHRGQGLLLAVARPIGRLLAEARFRVQRADFPQQRLVDAQGGLDISTREDFYTQFGMFCRMPSERNTDLRVLGSLELVGAYNNSNQNSYDARRMRFLSGYYDYSELRAATGIQALFGDARLPIVWAWNLSWVLRRYPHRPVQDLTGLYVGRRLEQRSWILSSTFRYPFDHSFSVIANWQYGRSTANQAYELVYAYNYTVSNYLFGISYEY